MCQLASLGCLQGAGLGLFLKERPQVSIFSWLRSMIGSQPEMVLARFPLATILTTQLIISQPGRHLPSLNSLIELSSTKRMAGI